MNTARVARCRNTRGLERHIERLNEQLSEAISEFDAAHYVPACQVFNWITESPIAGVYEYDATGDYEGLLIEFEHDEPAEEPPETDSEPYEPDWERFDELRDFLRRRS